MGPADTHDHVACGESASSGSDGETGARPPWDGDASDEWIRLPIARLRYTKSTGLWSLYWRDRHQRFHGYSRTQPTADVEKLLAEVDRDPTAIFWG